MNLVLDIPSITTWQYSWTLQTEEFTLTRLNQLDPENCRLFSNHAYFNVLNMDMRYINTRRSGQNPWNAWWDSKQFDCYKQDLWPLHHELYWVRLNSLKTALLIDSQNKRKWINTDKYGFFVHLLYITSRFFWLSRNQFNTHIYFKS